MSNQPLILPTGLLDLRFNAIAAGIALGADWLSSIMLGFTAWFVVGILGGLAVAGFTCSHAGELNPWCSTGTYFTICGAMGASLSSLVLYAYY